jgi:subtilase family serine protease
MPHSRILRRSLLAFSAAFFALLGMLAAAAPSQASLPSSPSPASMVSLTASLAPAVPAGATRLGALAPDTKLSIEVALNIPDQGALTAFLTGLSDPDSPDFQHFLAPGQFGPLFGPSLAQVAAVENALRSAGLSPGQVSANRLAIPVTAPASTIERAFGISLEGYRLPGGREAFANTSAPRMSAAVAPLVQGVLGLEDLYQLQHLTSGPPSATPLVSKDSGKVIGPVGAAGNPGPQPCSAAIGNGNTVNTFAGYYGPLELYTLGDLGQGARIGVLELEPNLASDISAYESCYDIHTRVSYTHIDGGAGSGAGVGEAALDIETVAGLAPKSEIDVYQAPNTGGGPGEGDYDIFKKFVTSDTDKVLSDSWGACEARTVAANVKAQESLFEQANAQGQTIFAAAGDSGSTGCYNADGSDALSALSPASAPYVIGVGGTSFSSSGSGQQEIVWNDSGSDSGAGGGGVSSIWCMPSYQHQTSIPGIVNAHSRKDTSSSCKSKYYREVPDISADGDPVFGYAVYWDGSWEDVGGTSAATPLWASVAALTDVSPFCAAYGSKGASLPQNLYNAVAAHHAYIYGAPLHVLRDVTSGNNDYTVSGYTGGLYPATKGYDMASGLGTPVVTGQSRNQWSLYLAGLTSVLCHQAATKLKTVKVTSVSPNSGPAGKKIKVTVHGSGFLPIGTADEAQIVSGSKVLATVDASCSTTACTLTLPAESARTVDIRIFANSLWGSGVSKADHFTYRRT